MTLSVRSLFDQAKRLSTEEQADLIDLLLTDGQLDPTIDRDQAWSAAWAAEADERVQSIEHGDTIADQADDVLAEGRRRLAVQRRGA